MENHLIVFMSGVQKMITIPKHSNIKVGDKVVISKIVEDGDDE